MAKVSSFIISKCNENADGLHRWGWNARHNHWKCRGCGAIGINVDDGIIPSGAKRRREIAC